MESTGLIVALVILFVVIGTVGSIVYYFARYYIKTDHDDKELFVNKAKSLDEALLNTRESLWGRITHISIRGDIRKDLRDPLEEILYSSDLGPQTAEILPS